MTEVSAVALAGIAQSLLTAKMVSLSACTITIGDEVEHIWLKPKYTRMTILWALNRYITPLGFIVIIIYPLPGSIEVGQLLRYWLFLLAAELGTKIVSWAVYSSEEHPPGLCLVGSPSFFSVLDSAMFILTLWRSIAYNHALNNGSTKSLMHLIQRDGTAYYATISIINLLTVVIFLFASNSTRCPIPKSTCDYMRLNAV
ncbi:hypothetical protein K443DRAFT_107994 [Laccaria amethystina LaAM-08-1]|uniref:DUF6533 domain-containing protein n=1 Tax=Laccaria amethystina LaAM-08-1 TaxID=1095629 RepID=A0A0C9WK76_9AGAR|nr:hypothetical protein K443DRAFT_107994 [Laccaria amethystina LaAM-08-1]